jgi:hypothetical protein
MFHMELESSEGQNLKTCFSLIKFCGLEKLCCLHRSEQMLLLLSPGRSVMQFIQLESAEELEFAEGNGERRLFSF